MQHTVLAASILELQEAYQQSVANLMQAQQHNQLAEVAELELQAEFWKIQYLERVEALSGRIGNSPTDS